MIEHKVHSDGSRAWRLNGKLHRSDGPAVIWANGEQEWWQNGKLHCTDGPAIIYPNGRKEWWIDDNFIKEYDPGVFAADWLKEGF